MVMVFLHWQIGVLLYVCCAGFVFLLIGFVIVVFTPSVASMFCMVIITTVCCGVLGCAIVGMV
jgi:hypothetical protein